MANIVPGSPIAIEGMPPIDGLLASIMCLSPTLVHSLRDAIVPHVVGNIPLIIKILLMPLTGSDNPLLCHYFCYYLEWVYGSEMSTVGDTLRCTEGGLGEEINDLDSLRGIRG